MTFISHIVFDYLLSFFGQQLQLDVWVRGADAVVLDRQILGANHRHRQSGLVDVITDSELQCAQCALHI